MLSQGFQNHPFIPEYPIILKILTILKHSQGVPHLLQLTPISSLLDIRKIDVELGNQERK